jgi:hypothetical protein
MKRHSWTAHDLSLAYYVAKFGWYGIKEDLTYWSQIINTTEKSLDMQINKFKGMLYGRKKLDGASELQLSLLRHFDQKPISYIRNRVEELRNGLK